MIGIEQKFIHCKSGRDFTQATKELVKGNFKPYVPGLTPYQESMIRQMPRIFSSEFCSLGFNWTKEVLEGKMSPQVRDRNAKLWAIKRFNGDLTLANKFINEYVNF